MVVTQTVHIFSQVLINEAQILVAAEFVDLHAVGKVVKCRRHKWTPVALLCLSRSLSREA